MDFLEDLLDFGDRKRRKHDGPFPNRDQYHDDHDDDRDHYPQYTNNLYPQAPANPAAIPSGIVCRNCSTPTIQGARFCHNCGQVIEMVTKCASCGSRIPTNVPFCPQCGYRNG